MGAENILMFALLCLVWASPLQPSDVPLYSVNVLNVQNEPLIAYVTRTTTFQQVFNPAWVPASYGTDGVSGILIRSQNCTVQPGDDCVHCGGLNEKVSVITFSKLLSGGDSQTPPQFSNVAHSNIVFGPVDATDAFGTEDPRLTYDPNTQLYYLFYTAYGSGVRLSLATTPNPTSADGWTRYGSVFPDLLRSSKSGALLIRPHPPHYLFWGDDSIRVATSTNLTSWTYSDTVLLAPRSDFFDSQLVESGPNPMLLSTGDYLFLYNSAKPDLSYHVGWVIVNGTDPTQVLARSSQPLFSPDLAWERGDAPWTCNVANVVFLQAIAPTERADVFRVYFGGADAVVGTAVIQVTYSPN